MCLAPAQTASYLIFAAPGGPGLQFLTGWCAERTKKGLSVNIDF